MSTGQRRLATLFNVQPAEERLVLLLLLHSFFLGVPLVFTETVANTLLLVNFGAAALPYVYIGFALVGSVTGLIYTRVEAWLSFEQLLIGTVATMAVSLVGIWLGLSLPGQTWLVAILAVWAEVLWVLAGLEFGALLGRLFTLRQGKRLFGLVGSGEVLAGILGGLLVPATVVLVGTVNLLLLAALCLAVALVLLLAVLRKLPPQAEQAAAARELPRVALGELLRSRYILSIVGFAALAMFCYFFLDSIFYLELAARYPNEDQLASFLGLFYALVGALTLLGKGLLSARLLERYGLTAGLLAMPVAVAAGAGLILASSLLLGGLGLFWLVAISKLLNELLKDAVDTPSSLILYQPLAFAQRLRAQALIESVVEPMAAGLAGLALILLLGPANLGTLGLTLVLSALLAVWILVGRRLGGAYRGALAHALNTQRIEGAAFSLQDSSTRALVLGALRSPHPAEVIYALDLLERGEEPELASRLAELLTHGAPEVRREAFGRLERLRPLAALPAVRAQLRAEREPDVVEVGLRALAVLGEEDAFEELAAQLDAPDHRVRRGAMVGLLRSGGIVGVLTAGQQLLAGGASAAPAERVLTAEILGAVGMRSFYQPLLPLLHDPDMAVRRAALQAAGQVGHPRLWPELVAALASPELRLTAETALVQVGAAIVELLRESLAVQPVAVRVRLARICGRIGGAPMVALLAEQLDAPASELRNEVLSALNACRFRAEGAQLAQVHRRLLGEAAEAAWMLAARRDIAGGAGAELLARALGHALGQLRTRLLLLLGMRFDAQVMGQLRAALEYGAPEQRSYALESLDGMLAADLKAALLPLLEELGPDEQLQRLGALFPQRAIGPAARLDALARGDEAGAEPWLRACACYAIGQQRLAQARPALQAAASEPDPLLRETAIRALAYIDSAGAPALPRAGDGLMLSTLEKVMTLKTVSIFAATADMVLVEIAAILSELEVRAGEQIFAQGDMGTSMYIIVSGRVRVHDGERTLNELGPRDVFGEMAMLDPEPRIASVSALEPSLLFRIDHGPFYEVMADRVEVARGIIRVLTGHLRARVRDVATLHQRVRELEGVVGAIPEPIS